MAKLKSGSMMAALMASVLASGLAGLPAAAKSAADPQSILPPPAPSASASPAATPSASASPAATPTAPATPVPAPPPLPVPDPVMSWSLADARALLGVIRNIEEEGLISVDYQPDALTAAIAAGPGAALDAVASKSFVWLAEDLRDGRTPMTARVQWFAVDPDVDASPTPALMAKALDTHDVAGVLVGLAPTYSDYQALKAALAATPKTERAQARDDPRQYRSLALAAARSRADLSDHQCPRIPAAAGDQRAYRADLPHYRRQAG